MKPYSASRERGKYYNDYRQGEQYIQYEVIAQYWGDKPHESPHSNDPESAFEELVLADKLFELQDERP